MSKIIFKRLAIKIIKGLLWILDSDHRSTHEIAMDNMKKFTHVIPQDFQSDFGHVTNAFRTVPYAVWELQTESKTLYAADKHRVIRNDHSCAWLEDLNIGDLIKTDNGLERVVSCRSLDFRAHMYCVEVETADPNDPNNHLLYTDGILSHNTTCAAGYLLWKAMFTQDATILITANKLVQALEIMDRIRYAYENLPDHIRAGVVEYNKGTIAFDNGSKIVSRATSSDAGRGLSITLLYCDEFAFVPPNKATEFWTSIQPVLSTGGSCIITSTPRSDEDQFAQIWHGARDNTDEWGNPNGTGIGKNGFFPISVTWDKHPERDEEWAKPFRESLGEARFRQEFCCDFVTDDETLINSLRLAGMKATHPVFYTDTTRWFQAPEANRTYIVALDPSLGTGGDYAAIQIFQLPEMIQIGEWQHNQTTTRDQVKVLKQILHFIDDEMRADPAQHSEPEIFWTVENNTLGEAVLNVIDDTGEERFPGVFISEKKKKGQSRRFRKGLTTDAKKKMSSCAKFKSLVESNRMHLRSAQLIKQLKFFVSSNQNGSTYTSFKAKSGEHDDLVMAALMCVRIIEVVASWGTDIGDLKEHISDNELYEEAMPVVF